MPWDGARGQNLGHLRIFLIFFCFYFSVIESFLFEQKVLFRVDFLSVTSGYSVHCPRVGLALGVKI